MKDGIFWLSLSSSPNCALWLRDWFRQTGLRVSRHSRGHLPNPAGMQGLIIAFSGSSFISNAWREPGDTNVDHSFARVGFALLGRMGSNVFHEFWPDTKRKLLHRAGRD